MAGANAGSGAAARDETIQRIRPDPQLAIALLKQNASAKASTSARLACSDPWYWTGTSAIAQANGPYIFAWHVAFGRAGDGYGKDLHGAGAVRFDVKVSGLAVEVEGEGEGDGSTLYYVRLVRNAN